jgi:hypothetical protein
VSESTFATSEARSYARAGGCNFRARYLLTRTVIDGVIRIEGKMLHPPEVAFLSLYDMIRRRLRRS